MKKKSIMRITLFSLFTLHLSSIACGNTITSCSAHEKPMVLFVKNKVSGQWEITDGTQGTPVFNVNVKHIFCGEIKGGDLKGLHHVGKPPNSVSAGHYLYGPKDIIQVSQTQSVFLKGETPDSFAYHADTCLSSGATSVCKVSNSLFANSLAQMDVISHILDAVEANIKTITRDVLHSKGSDPVCITTTTAKPYFIKAYITNPHASFYLISTAYPAKSCPKPTISPTKPAAPASSATSVSRSPHKTPVANAWARKPVVAPQKTDSSVAIPAPHSGDKTPSAAAAATEE